MKFTEIISDDCCGRKLISVKIERPLTKEDVNPFIVNGFSLNKKYMDSGIFYMENDSIILRSTFGNNLIVIKTKNKKTFDDNYNILINIISKMQ